jgi:hypothetical protein
MDKQVSELNEPRWAVVSERGVETTGATYAAAADAVKRLRTEDVRGLCIVADEAAGRFTGEEQTAQKDAPVMKDAT